MDAIGRLEEGYLVIVWNPELHTYMQFREEHPDVIEAACKGEDQDYKVRRRYLGTIYGILRV